MTTEEIIINFFEGKCDAQDVAIVYAWLKENPAKLDAYIAEQEWEDFQPAGVLSSEISGKLWNGIKKNNPSPLVRYSFARWIAVAALVLLVIGLPWLLIFKRQKASIISAGTVATTRRVLNNTLSKMTLMLSDGSKVELLPNSTLSYPEGFNAAKRAVILKGEANFSIATDVAKPFTVYSNSVLTTVLGTRFTVKSYEANNTSVILHEGRVMIKISNSSSQGNRNEYYLTPGDIFILNKVNAPSRPVNKERMISADSLATDPLAGLSADSLSVRVLHIEKDKDDSYLFNNYPLDVVFDQLQVIYNTTIVYDKSKLGNRSFIGKIDKKDSLCNILKGIALLNNFSLRKQGDSILIGSTY